MEVKHKISYISDQFRFDPLFNRLRQLDLLNTLLSEDDNFLAHLSFENKYSTKKAAQLLKIPSPQTLINLLTRNDFNSNYLKVGKLNNRFYSYNWEALFKFRMILLLMENDFSPLDIAWILTKHNQGETNKVVYLEQTNDFSKTLDIKLKEQFNTILKIMKTNEENLKINEKNLKSLLSIQNQIGWNEFDLKFCQEIKIGVLQQLDNLKLYKKIVETISPRKQYLFFSTKNLNVEKKKQELLKSLIKSEETLTAKLLTLDNQEKEYQSLHEILQLKLKIIQQDSSNNNKK